MYRYFLFFLFSALFTQHLFAKKNRFQRNLSRFVTKSWISPVTHMRNTLHTINRTTQHIKENFHVVQKNKLYRSGQLSPKRLTYYIKKYGIKTVINLRGENHDKKWWQQERDVTLAHDVAFYNIPMSADELTSRDKLIELLNIYDTAPLPLLIHCRVGVDRTGEAAAIWVMEKMGKSNKKALEQLSLTHRHFSFMHPNKTKLISIWNGRDWLFNEYNPEDCKL